MSNLKTDLMCTGAFIDNEYLDLYVSLVERNRLTPLQKRRTQKHHIVPRYYFKFNKMVIDNSSNNVVNLLYRDHFLAHALLMMCSSTEKFANSNYTAILRMGECNFSDIREVMDDRYMCEMQSMYESIKVNNPMHNAKHKAHHDEIMRKKETRQKISASMKEKHARGELFTNEHRRHLSESTKGMVYVHKDGKYTSVKPDKIDEYLKGGWELGNRPLSDSHKEALIKSRIGYKFSDESREKMRKSHLGQTPHNKGVPHSDSTKKKISEFLTGTKWVNNGVVQKQVRPEHVNEYLNNGFVLGQLKRKR